MVAVFVLIAGVFFMMVVGGVFLVAMGRVEELMLLVMAAPMLIMVGSALLGLAELLLFLGGKEERRIAIRDFCYIVPTFLVSAALLYAAQTFLG